MKVWKRAMRPVKGLTLCGKRINQYCDQDRDKRVSITEWTVCLDVASGKNYFCDRPNFMLTKYLSRLNKHVTQYKRLGAVFGFWF